MGRFRFGQIFFIFFLMFFLSACTEEEMQAYKQATSPSPVKSVTSEKQEMIKKDLISNGGEGAFYEVTRVVDGDTIDVDMDGKIKRIRMIGVNTPESVDPRRTVECFGIEASNKAKELLSGQKVRLEADPSQDNQDKYGRLLRYIWRADGFFYNLEIIKAGYAYEYTYQLPYKFQKEFKEAQKQAENQKAGLWADDACAGKKAKSSDATTGGQVASSPASSTCNIKGNINSKKEKIYHLISCGSYNDTVIDTSQGERWFCSEDEAIKAGWRKAGNCK